MTMLTKMDGSYHVYMQNIYLLPLYVSQDKIVKQ